MADDADEPPFKSIGVKDLKFEPVPYPCSKKPKLEVDPGSEKPLNVKGRIYKATFSGHGDKRNEFVVIRDQYYLALHTLRSRLEDPVLRQSDFETLRKDKSAKPFKLWDEDGSPMDIPATLIFYTARKNQYDDQLDERQLKEWKKIAKKLDDKPSEKFNSDFRRFSLKPSNVLKAEVKKRKDVLVYCSPANPPAFGVDKDRLDKIIWKKESKFPGWPKPRVIEYEEAERMGLKLVGNHFLQLYFTWMKPEYYKELWESEPYNVTKLLHALPAKDDEQTYEKVAKMLKKVTAESSDGGVSANIVVRGSDGRGSTATVMGQSATDVAKALWGTDYITSGMGKTRNGVSTVEWLHRMAYSLGGEDVFNNLVFGTWECNTDMIRAENLVREVAKRTCVRKHQGKLTTTNKPPGEFPRPDRLGEATDAIIPSWAKEYPWLCFSLTYLYQMAADKCPLKKTIAHEVNFDPWSIYVPLSMEPKLDEYILKDLLSPRSSDDTVLPEDLMAGESSGNMESNIEPMVQPNALPFVNMMAMPRRLLSIHVPDHPTLAWNAAIRGLPSVELPDIIVKKPTVASHPSHSRRSIPIETPIPQGGFVLQGEVDLFGTAVVGNLQKWIGPAPGDVVVGSDPPSIERVHIPGDFHLSMLIPFLDGTPFDKMIFQKVTIYHQNYAFDKTQSVGWHFNADWVINPSCGLLHDIVRTVLQIDQPILSIRAAFGTSLQWTTPLNLQSFILEGVFPNLTLSPVSGLTLTSIGVRLLGIRGFSFAPEPHSTLSFGFGIFGTMKLDVPGSVVPLNLDYEIGLVAETVNLRAELSGSIWEDALGVEGLLLEDVVFGASFSATSPLKTFAFDVSATFLYLSSVAYLQGSYAAGGKFSLTAELDNFGIDELNDFFFALFGDFLTLPDFDVHIGSAVVSIASGQGLSISLHNVKIADYTDVSLKVTLSSSGASLSGKLSTSAITFGDVELHDALIELAFWTTDKKKKVDFMLGGKLRVDFLDLEVEAAVHLYPGNDGIEWAVVAELSAPSRPFAISDVVPSVKGTFVNFSLRNAVIIAASQDDPLTSRSFPGYDVRKGVQVFGVIDRIQALNHLLREDVRGLVFNAGWSKASGFNLMISLPAKSSIHFGNGMKTTPITLGIRTSPIALAITAGIAVPVKDSTPLDFSFVLAANFTGASASAEMEGWWKKPFGIDHLMIGPEVTLSIDIEYAQFLATGTPSGFGVSGGLMIGNIQASLAMSISEDPKRELLFGMVKNLDISDVVEFAGTLVQEDLPKIPDNLLKFEELEIYVCPFGVVLGKTVYPQGFSFKADLLFFGKRADIECKINTAQKSVDILGGIDNFELGPLTVRGFKGPRATLECEVGVSKQQLKVNGAVSIFDLQAKTYIDVQFLPDPKFKFHLMVQWADIFMLKLDAELLGSIRDRLSDADFSFYAELENHILEYIAQHVIEQFEAAKAAVARGIDAAEKKVEDTKKDWEDTIAAAEKKVDDAQQKWESYEKHIRSSNQRDINNYLANISRLEGAIAKTEKDYNNAMDDAERRLNKANQDRAAAFASAERKVADAKRDMDNKINAAQRKLDDAKADLSRAFGNAQRDIDHAQRDVDSLQNKIDGIKRTIDEYEDASGWEFWKKAAIPGLWIAVETLEASKDVATGLLDAAHAILTGSEYVAKKGAVGAAIDLLDLAKSAGDATLSLAQGELRVTDKLTKGVVDDAEGFLEDVKKGVDFVAFQGAKEALELFKKTEEAGYKIAMAAIEGLMDSADFIAYNVAKAGLAVAKASTKLLDVAKGALALVEKATEATLTILEDVVKWAAKILNITTIILSGTLRGILGLGGASARPLRAVIKGYVVGRWFDIEVEFDLRKPLEFITAIFKELWHFVSSAFKPSSTPSRAFRRSLTPSSPILMAVPMERHLVVEKEAMDDMIQPESSRASRHSSMPFSSTLMEVPTGGHNLLVEREAMSDMIQPESSRAFRHSSMPFSSTLMEVPTEGHNLLVEREAMDDMMQPEPSLDASSRFLQQRPDILRMLMDDSKSVSTAIPRGPFSDRQMVSPLVVARKALTLIQEARGISVFEDLDGMHG